MAVCILITLGCFAICMRLRGHVSFKALPCACAGPVGPKGLTHGDSIRQISADMPRCSELALVMLHTHQLSNAWMRSE